MENFCVFQSAKPQTKVYILTAIFSSNIHFPKTTWLWQHLKGIRVFSDNWKNPGGNMHD